MNFKAPRGTFDVLPEEAEKWQYIEECCRKISYLFNYQEIRTPIFEHTELFTRGVGESSDIVSKEMYTFLDKGERYLTLRPELTAPVARAFVEHNFDPNVLHKLFYIGPIFRYERPQKGRYRQSHQFGIEAIGSQDPSLDAEIILMAYQLYEMLGIKDLSILLNSIGCQECRPAYKKILKEFLGENTDKLCSDCQRRTDANPLRALDCKQQSCITLTEQAPVIIDHLCSDCSQHFNKVKEYLQMFKIPYQLNNRLVRGLDYYTRTVFEVVSNQLGAQNSLCGGGRYDGLIKLIGGKDTPAVGFAAGLERMLIVREEIGAELPAKKKPFVYLIGIGEEGRQEALKLLENLRQSGISADTDYKNKSLKSNFKEAAKLQIPYVIVIGEDEIKAGEVVLKDMEKGSQEKVKATELLELLLQKG